MSLLFNGAVKSPLFIRKRAPSNVTLIAEIGTLQLEFMTLSLHTGKSIYAEKVETVR